MNTVFCSPCRYTQGPNATENLGTEMTGLGLKGPVLIVAGHSARSQLEATWRKALGDAGIEHTIHPFGGECTHDEIARIASTARAIGANTILGAGGGKSLDAGRAAAADLGLPVVNCPTIASTDAPCSALSVIYNEAGEFQEFRIYGKNPDLVLVDTQVIANAPVRQLISGMGDALSTWFEARACAKSGARNMRGGLPTRSALALAELCYKTLLADGIGAIQAAERNTITPALDRIIESNILLSGLGFESAGLAAAHSVHNGLTAVLGSHAFLHGEKVAFGVIVQLVMEGSDRAELNEVLSFSASLGLPMTLADIGCQDLSKEMLGMVAARATAPGETIHNEPFEVMVPMVEDAILAADAAGRAFKA
jgi:glycerol dehydrogenase